MVLSIVNHFVFDVALELRPLSLDAFRKVILCIYFFPKAYRSYFASMLRAVITEVSEQRALKGLPVDLWCLIVLTVKPYCRITRLRQN